MAHTATPATIAALRGSAGRRGDRRTEVADLRDELVALQAERDAFRGEIVRLRDLLTYAFGTDSWSIALGVRDRLASLVTRLERRARA